MLIKTRGFSETGLSRFRDLQRMSFAILEETAAGLAEGDTKKEIAYTLVKRYRAAGAGSFFHLPVVLFGERAALPGKWPVGKFFPRSRSLEPGRGGVIGRVIPLMAPAISTRSPIFGMTNTPHEAITYQ